MTAALAICAFAMVATCIADQRPQDTVTLTSVPTMCKPFAIAVGQRLQKPGKERITGSGTLLSLSNGSSRTSPVQVVWQIPLKIRIDAPGAPITLDWSQSTPPGQAAKDNSDTLESLLDDSIEGLTSIDNQAGSSRLIGKGFRDKGSNPTGQAFDVLQLSYRSTLRNGASLNKLYWFDSKTKLLSRVTYNSTSGGSVEVRLSDWRTVQGETIPFLIERQENGQVTMRLTLASVAVGNAAQDGIFGGSSK